jgi:hypothetical protein
MKEKIFKYCYYVKILNSDFRKRLTNEMADIGVNADQVEVTEKRNREKHQVIEIKFEEMDSIHEKAIREGCDKGMKFFHGLFNERVVVQIKPDRRMSGINKVEKRRKAILRNKRKIQ